MFPQLLVVSVLALIGWFILMFLTTNLLGLFTDSEIDKLGREGPDFLKEEVKKGKRADMVLNVIALVSIVGFFYLLFHFLNMYALLAALMLLAGRLPDLIWEIKHGKKIDVSTMTKNATFYLTSLLDWVSFPVFWYAVYLALPT